MSAPPGEVGVELLLGRRAVAVDAGQTDYLCGRTVVVTGAGGSVGCALAERLAGLELRRLVLIDQAEAPLAALRALERGPCPVTAVLADVTSRARMADLLAAHDADVVLHAAAYKHVTLLEESPVEGAATNVLGTKSVVDAAVAAGVERLVLFSTDKAVQPNGVLGMTKAVAERVVASAGREHGTRYTSIRLANVVGSAGSIVPTLRRQLDAGGPLTLTHPEATRYLMTASEAAGLAIAAGGLGEPDGVYWLDVGEPVPVVELARRVVGAREVEIEFVGLRPGENLHERLRRDGDAVQGTAAARVMRTALPPVDAAWLEERLADLLAHVRAASAPAVRALLAELAAPAVELRQAAVL